MVIKKLLALICLSFLVWSCSTFHPIPPALYIGELPTSGTVDLSLNERLIAEEAWSHLRQGNIDKARKLFSKLGTSNPFYYIGMGYSSYILQDLKNAEKSFKYALELKPESILAQTGLIQIHEEAGLADLAFTGLRKILIAEPDHIWAKSRYESIRDERTSFYLDEAKTFLASGGKRRAKEAFLKSLYFAPDSIEAHRNLSEMFIQEKNWESALIHLQALIETNPYDFDIRKQYAEVLYQKKDYKASFENYEKIKAAGREDQQIENRIQQLKNRLGIFDYPNEYNSILTSDAVTRQEMAAIIVIKFQSIMNERMKKPPIIVDIAMSWAQKYIIKTALLGIMDVYSTHEFYPEKVMTRAETADILIRLIDYLQMRAYSFIVHISPENIQINDISPNHFYYPSIIKILSYDIMSLESNKRFHPNSPVSGRKMIQYMDVILALIQK